MYLSAWRATRRAWLLFAVIAGLMAVAGLYLKGTSLVGAALAVSAIIAFQLHRVVLLNEPVPLFRAQKNKAGEVVRPFGFMWRMLVLICIPLLVSVAAAFFVAFRIAATAPADMIVGIFILIYGAMFYLVMAWLGTMLPAAAVQGDASLAAAHARGKRMFWRTLWRLLAGNLLFIVVWIGFAIVVETVLPGVLPDVAWSFLGQFAMFVALALTVAALSETYRECEGLLPPG